MILWLIALATLTCGGIVGFYQGALRVAGSFVGLLLAAWLASPLGAGFKSIVPVRGIKNPVAIAFVAPVIGLLVVLMIFRVAAAASQKQIAAWSKSQASDTQRLLFERMNARVGIPLALANRVIYFFLICTLVYSVG